MRAPALKLRAKPAPELPEAASPEESQPALSSDLAWTGGSALATRVVTVALWACLVAGPMGLALHVLGGSPQPVSAPAAASETKDADERAAVSSFAQDFVTAWLTTPRGQEQAVTAFLPPSVRVALPAKPWLASNPSTSGILETTDGLWSTTVAITVSADLTVPGVRRYFQLPVRSVNGGLIAQALPAPVPAPPIAAAAEINYEARILSTHPIAVAAGEFLTAVLVSGGDVTRFISPGAKITAILPAPYAAVEVDQVLVDQELSDADAAPTTGKTVRVLVSATAAADSDHEISIQYALTMSAREGRWEVAAIDAVPLSAPRPGDQNPSSVTPSPGTENGSPQGVPAPTPTATSPATTPPN